MTEIAGARLQDWQFKQAFIELFGRVTDQALEQPNAFEWTDNALDTFFTQQGVTIEDTTETAPLDG